MWIGGTRLVVCAPINGNLTSFTTRVHQKITARVGDATIVLPSTIQFFCIPQRSSLVHSIAPVRRRGKEKECAVMASNGRGGILVHKLAEVLLGPNVAHHHLSVHADGAELNLHAARGGSIVLIAEKKHRLGTTRLCLRPQL